MLKEVMMGAGGIMLAAAIFASSVTPNTGPATQESAVPPVVPPVVATVVAPTPPPVFSDETGDSQFGAPMIEPAPADSGDVGPLSPEPEVGDETGGRQFSARSGRSYPIPE